MWEHGIVKYMKDKSIVFYNVDVGKDFLRERISVKVTSGERDIMRSVHVLDEYLSTCSISKKSVHPRVIGLWGEIGVAAKAFIEQQKSARRCETTLGGYTLYLSYFITHLTKSGITSVTAINESAILQFMSSLINNRRCVVSTLRLFCRFLYEKGETIHDLSYILSGYKYKEKREKLPSVYTREEVKEIESIISRVSAVGKRDYAILLLASRLGLRASDIAGLRFSNLDWEKSLIRLQQYKTKREIELPLLAEVGESIIKLFCSSTSFFFC
ncbi:MAG: tyrosine-type recombinase/integrase, partial [Candidatus Symbiothrix sp.]|jgi:integrase|nr:tyrosine-type recombinase/integrase [Candidatus Symbiothrix sp.]